MNPPDWMLPEGTHGVRAEQIRKDWRNRTRRQAMIDVAKEGGGTPMEQLGRLHDLVCFELIEGGRK